MRRIKLSASVFTFHLSSYPFHQCRVLAEPDGKHEETVLGHVCTDKPHGEHVLRFITKTLQFVWLLDFTK